MAAISELEQISGEILRVVQQLGATWRDEPAHGFIPHFSGGFWNASLVEKLTRLYRKSIEYAKDESERSAARYSLAAHLMCVLALDDAADECENLIQSDPDRAYGNQHLLAIIEARRGNLDRAFELARVVNAHPDAVAFRIDLRDLQEQFENGLRERKRQGE